MPVEAQSPQFVCFTDEPFDAIAEMAQGWDMRYEQLEAGHNASDLIQLRLGGVDVARERVRRMVEIHGTAPLGSVVFGLLDEPGGELTSRGCRADSDTLVYQVSSKELDHRVRGALLSFVVDIDILTARVGHSALKAVLRRDRVTLAPAKVRALRRLSHAAMTEFRARPELQTSPAVAGALAEHILAQIVGALRVLPGEDRASKSGPRPIRLTAAKDAETLILKNLDRRLSVDGLVHVTAVGRSALRAGFVERFGHGPQAHIAALRLNAVRRALRAPEPGSSVTEVATRFGFWHLGRFAQAYRRLFGEFPSATLAGKGAGNRGDCG